MLTEGHLEVLAMAWLGNAALIGIGVGIMGKIVSNLKAHMEKFCGLKHDAIAKELDKLADEDTKLWDAFNTHGHKGLMGNDSKVVR